MIVYFRTMRIKDEQKQTAIIEATVKLVNEIGFVASSVAKIAKEANVSPATLYIYYKNKEDLLVSTYVTIKQELSEAMLERFDKNAPIRDILERVWFNAFAHIKKYPAHFLFAEQFSNCPYSSLVNKAELEQYFIPFLEVLQRGIEQKIIKNVPFDILFAFIFFPVLILSNQRHCEHFETSKENIHTAFTLAWDAIKL